jgi:hypothetical protein
MPRFSRFNPRKTFCLPIAVLVSIRIFAPLHSPAQYYSSSPITLKSPSEVSGQAGWAICAVPDTDGDGQGEVAVAGATTIDLFDASTGISPIQIGAPVGQAGVGFNTYSFAGLPDMNGNGSGDLLVGGGGTSEYASPLNCGSAFVHDGASGQLLKTIPYPHECVLATDFGDCVSGVPDLTGDGVVDFVVCAALDRSRGWGGTYVFNGVTGTLVHELHYPAHIVTTGQSVLGVPDLSGDGRGDILVGVSGGNEGSGFVDVYNGATGGLIRRIFSPNPLYNPNPGTFGRSISSVPDVNGDGAADIAVGAPNEGEWYLPRMGRAYIFDGATGVLLQSLVSHESNRRENGRFGAAVSGVHDVNWDGCGDLLVGAPGECPVRYAGQAHLFDGATGRSLQKFVSINQQEYGRFGTAVCNSPDVNGDGLDEVIIGSNNESTSGSPLVGRAYIYYSQVYVETSAVESWEMYE